jgi:hypothetical protein
MQITVYQPLVNLSVIMDYPGNAVSGESHLRIAVFTNVLSADPTCGQIVSANHPTGLEFKVDLGT